MGSSLTPGRQCQNGTELLHTQVEAEYQAGVEDMPYLLGVRGDAGHVLGWEVLLHSREVEHL